MQLGNTRTSYGWVAIALHWIAAIAVIWLYLGGDDAGEAPTRAARAPLLAQHVSLGMAFLLVLALRVFWSFTQPRPEKLAKGFWVTLLARIVQYGFLAMIVVMIVTGPLVIWALGRPIQIYDWFAVPSPFSVRMHWLHELCETIHKYAAKALWPLLILHVLGALKSVVFDRDRTVQRMLWVKRPS